MHTVLISKYPKRTLEEIRKLRGLTTAEAALKVGMTKEYYEKIEKMDDKQLQTAINALKSE